MANYTIDINFSGFSKDKNGVIAGQETQEKTTDLQGENKEITKSLVTFIATQAVEPFIKSAINFAGSNVGLVSGSEVMQQQVDFAMQTISAGKSLISSTSAGATLGGPIGAIVGFAVGTLSLGVNILLKQSQIDLKKANEDIQISYIQQRAQFDNSRRGY